MTKTKPLVIVGSGRSGTTWLQDVIAQENNFRAVFEPLHPTVSHEASLFGNRYLSASSNEPQFKRFIDEVLAGRCNTIWTRYRIVPYRLWPKLRHFTSVKSAKELYRRYRSLVRNIRAYRTSDCDGIVVKFIRANLMLDWLAQNFDVNLLFVLRHPGAVIESKIRLDAVATQNGSIHGTADWDPYPLLKQFYRDEPLRRQLLDKYLPNLDIDSLTPVEAQTVVWCVENVSALTSNHDNLHLVCYEWLSEEDGKEWQLLAEKFGLEVPDLSQSRDKPSQQASPDFRAATSLEEKMSRWRERLSEEDKGAMQTILNQFGITIYQMDKVWPLSRAVLNN